MNELTNLEGEHTYELTNEQRKSKGGADGRTNVDVIPGQSYTTVRRTLNITYFDHNDSDSTEAVERIMNTDIPDYEKADQKDNDQDNAEENGEEHRVDGTWTCR